MNKRWLWGLIVLLLWTLPVWAQDTDAGYQEALRRIEAARVSGATELDLSVLGLTELPPEIGQLKSLQILNLSENQLTMLPQDIGQLINLRELYIDNNQLTSLPLEIGQLTDLQQLNLTRNQLTSLPPEIGQLVNLWRLGLADNQLTSLPPEIGQLVNLKSFYLADNQLKTLPPEIGQLSKLEWFLLNNNPWVTLPPEFNQLPHPLYIYSETDLLPLEVRAQGSAAIIGYINDSPNRLTRRTLIDNTPCITGVVIIAGVLLLFRWRQRRGLSEKKKRL